MGITVNQYDKYLEELAGREEELNAEFSQLTSNDTSFVVTASYLLEIAKEAPRLFRSSKPALQRKLLKFVLSNLTIKGNKIDFNLKTPFDTIAECSKTSNWPWEVKCVLRTRSVRLRSAFNRQFNYTKLFYCFSSV